MHVIAIRESINVIRLTFESVASTRIRPRMQRVNLRVGLIKMCCVDFCDLSSVEVYKYYSQETNVNSQKPSSFNR